MNKERLRDIGKTIKALYYGPFGVLKKVGDNSYILSLLRYMCMYSIVNVKNLKVYEPPTLYKEEDRVLPSIEDLALDAQVNLVEDTIL